MSFLEEWSRRQFLAASSAAAAHRATRLHPFLQASQRREGSVIPAPIDITGGIKPLFKDNTARPLRYTPINRDFVVRNGSEFFNRPIYGPISDFRVDAGDRPEFSLYLPGHGGNLKLGIATSRGAKWAAESDEVVARYRPGRMIYEIRDALLPGGSLRLELLTMAAGSGVMLRVDGVGLSPSTSLLWAFAGASGRKGSRSGDIGCESEPVSRFFQVRPEECAGNVYALESADIAGGSARPSSRLKSPAGELLLAFPPGSLLAVRDFSAWGTQPSAHPPSNNSSPKLPILTGSLPLTAAPVYFTIQRIKAEEVVEQGDPATLFEARSRQVAAFAGKIRVGSPDPCIDAAAAAMGVVAEGLWDPKQECVMHGCVAWRATLAGWRGPYVLDSLGEHERAIKHFRHWLGRQNISPVTTADPATGPADPGTRLARKELMLHSNGDVSHNHYDMNMVFFDVLLRHLRWTGDADFAREAWPAFQRHLAWEHRMFRRTFIAKDGRTLPLYEAYPAIWASDNLQYSGGGVAHSSAYNIFSFRFAAVLARLLGDDPAPYETEAELIHQGMQELLWLPEQGAFGESKDLLGPQTVYSSPALWTVYHTIDSEVPTARQAWQMAAERLAVLKNVPVNGDGVPSGGFLLSCSDWLPYMWSLNLIVLAENMHMALAMWQAGMRDDACRLFKGNVLDSMFQGLCPGNFHMSSALDPHRQESQRDFGDPTGIASRALVEGLFGIQPNLIQDSIRIRPGFPSDWNHASLAHKDFDFAWHRDGSTDVYEFKSRFPRAVPLTLLLPARTTSLPVVANAGAKVACSFDPAAVGSPALIVKLPAATNYSISVKWRGQPPTAIPSHQSLRAGEALALPHGISPSQIDDPQHCLSGNSAALSGFHTVFANISEGDCKWSLPISFRTANTDAAFLPVPAADAAMTEPIDLAPVLQHQLAEIFTRVYAEPRSPFCSASIPDTLLGGWSSLGKPELIDDAGLRAAGGMLKTPLGVPFRTPAGQAPNCVFLSHFHPDQSSIAVPLAGRASGLYLLMAGSTHPQCSRMEHALVTVAYSDGTTEKLSLRNPETWWPIEQDYLIDDYIFVDTAPPPPRVDLRTGRTRILDPTTFKGKGRGIPGGSANIIHIPLDARRSLASLKVEASLYPVVIALLAATLVRPSA